MLRNYHAFGFGGNKAESSSPFAGRSGSDQLTLSKQVLSIIELQNKIREIRQAREEAANSPEAQMLDTMQRALKTLKSCSTIAARIKAGDKVPLKDLRYLMQNDPQAYHMAMAARTPKENPKKWESAIPKDEQEENRSVADVSGQAGGTQASSGVSSADSSSDGTGPCIA